MTAAVRFLTATLSLSLLTLAACDDGSDNATVGEVADADGDADATELRNLIAIGYNDSTRENELQLIDVETAETTLLKSFTFDVGWWYPGIISDPDNETLYCVSGSETLYSLAMDGSSVNAVGALTKNMQAAGIGPDGIIGIGYSNLSGKNVLRTVDSETAEVTDVMSFSFNTANWQPKVIIDNDAEVIYAASADNTIHRIQIDGSAVDTLGQYEPYVVGELGIDGLIGISETEGSDMYDVVTLNPSTAEVAVLNSFQFDTNGWHGYIVTDRDAGVFYAISDANTLYRFQMDDGSVEEVGTIRDDVQAMGIAGY